MNIILKNVHFVRYTNQSARVEDLRALTRAEAEAYWDIISYSSSSDDRKIDLIMELCSRALPDIIRTDEDSLDVTFDVDYEG